MQTFTNLKFEMKSLFNAYNFNKNNNNRMMNGNHHHQQSANDNFTITILSFSIPIYFSLNDFFVDVIISIKMFKTRNGTHSIEFHKKRKHENKTSSGTKQCWNSIFVENSF